ncbi:SCO7613 C-terminal domain-containing membrane protein [Streptomyces sp. Act143]|uniref:SCO7613 C-terminal domain-containing membrane protein n=1 Tax=Streptomyces sp. Act143 TaxID=2200760 RepID=UPI00215A7B70|nr:hypothetical protein [Streptomyces sp. Act143]
MTHIPPPAEELRLLDAELFRLDARRNELLRRRAWLVAALYAPAPAAPRPTARGPEAAAPRVQNVLLLLGGVLLVIAATAFTLVSWGDLGITGRALVLGAVTAAVLAAPVALLKRGLRSTAESVAGLGLALTVLDTYALHGAVFVEAAGAPYTAITSAVLGSLWVAYGRLPAMQELRLPLPAALAAAQLPLLCGALALGADAYGITAALLLTAAFDTAVALRATARPVRLLAVVGAYGLGGSGVWAAGSLSWTATGPSAAARAAALLLLAATIALVAAWRGAGGRREPGAATAPADGLPDAQGTAPGAAGARPAAPGAGHALGLSVASALLAVAALGGVARSALPGTWTVPVHLAVGIALLAAVRSERLPETVRRGFAAASGAVQVLAVAWTLPVVAVTLLGPVGWVFHVWSGAPADLREAVTVDAPWPPDAATAPLVLVAVAAVLVLAVRHTDRRPRALTGALALTWAAALTLPAVLELPYTLGLLVLGSVTGVVLASPYGQPTATVLALATSADLGFAALASQSATLTALAALTAFFAVVSWRHTALTAPTALAHATALACATGAAADWQPRFTALLVLAVPAVAAVLAGWLKDTRATVAVEITGAVTGVLAITLAATDLPMLALVLSLCGVIAAGTALRPDRHAVGYPAAALFLLATWVRLAAWEVGTPEAYTLPVTVAALIVGFLHRRREPRTSSWTAYGPGLAATLLPSLAAAWGDAGWTRPLLLGLAALSLTLLGGGYSLQAPLVLGGSVLALDTLHELAPYIVQVTDALPRWVPPALAGLLLLSLGATYERRIRDVRRMRDVLGRMS